MQSNFDFLSGKFPELAEYGRKAEKYLYADNEVCMFFISRIFDNAVKCICSFNDVETDGTKLAEPINELFKKKAVDESIYLLLEMMRSFRNGNAHNKDYSLNDSMTLLQMSHILCEWLMVKYGQTGYRRKGFSMPENQDYTPGEVVECTVQNVMVFGVLVSFGGMSGMLHRTEIPSGSTEGYSIGDTFTAKILSINAAQHYAVMSVIELFTAQPTPPKPQPAQPTAPKPAQPTAPKPQPAQPTAPKPQPTPQQSSPPTPKAPAMSDANFLKLCATADTKKISSALSNGANVNAADSKGHTALMMAVLKNPHPEVIDLLINSGANVNAKTKRGINALAYAPHNKQLKLSKTLARLEQLTQI